MEAGVREASNRGDFSDGSVKRHVLRLAVPMTAAQLINLLYSVVDRMYLGRLAETGSLALTGVGIVLPVISILTAFTMLCGTGGAPLFSIARGRGDDEEAEKILGNSFSLLILMGIITTTIVIIFKKQILYAFGASDDTFPYASEYLTIYTMGTIFVMIGLGMNPFINAQGAAKRGMMTVAIGAVVNIVLDPIFIFVFDMGVAGAAYATIIAQGCAATWAMLFLCGNRAICKLRVSSLRLEAKRVGRIVSLGLSGFVMNLTNSLIQIVCNRTLQTYGGDLYVGVMTIINALREIIFVPISGLNSAMTPVLGFNYGAGQSDRVRQGIRFSMSITVMYMACISAVIIGAPRMMIRIFTDDPAMIDAGVRSVRIYFSMSIIMSLQMSSQVVFLSLGKSKYAVFFSLLRKAMISAPLTVLLPRIIGIDGVFFADAISQVIGGISCSLVMYLTQYRKLGKQPERLSE